MAVGPSASKEFRAVIRNDATHGVFSPKLTALTIVDKIFFVIDGLKVTINRQFVSVC